MAAQTKSPFAELSFSEQQEQWRVFRAKQLDYQAVNDQEITEPKPAPAQSAAAMHTEKPRHGNLDRVRAQLAAAARHAGAFQPVSGVRE